MVAPSRKDGAGERQEEARNQESRKRAACSTYVRGQGVVREPEALFSGGQLRVLYPFYRLL